MAGNMEVKPLSMELHLNEKNTTEGGDLKNKAMTVQVQPNVEEASNSTLIEPTNVGQSDGHYDKPLPCYGCGIGWFLFLMGFVFPPLWYYATVLYFRNYYLKDPRERPGLAASAIAALICSVIVFISLLAVFC